MYCGSQISDYRISDVRLAEALVVDNNILFPLLTFAACLCHSLSFAKRTSHRFERTHSPRSFYNLFLFFFPFLHEMLFANDKQQTSKSIRRTGEHILPQTNKLVAGLCDSTLTFLTNELRDARIAELAQDRWHDGVVVRMRKLILSIRAVIVYERLQLSATSASGQCRWSSESQGCFDQFSSVRALLRFNRIDQALKSMPDCQEPKCQRCDQHNSRIRFKLAILFSRKTTIDLFLFQQRVASSM